MTHAPFHMDSPRDLLSKFRYDVSRLSELASSYEIKYAALDCANDAWHMVDWVLASVSAEDHRALCGKNFGEHGATDEFLSRHKAELPRLNTCRAIANSGKHLVLRKPSGVQTSTSVEFNPPFDSSQPSWSGELKNILYIEDTDGQHRADAYFAAALVDWEAYLTRLGFRL